MPENKQKITFIATGGTIDKYYNSSSQKNEMRKNSKIPQYLLDVVGLDINDQFQSILNVDSRDMTSSDRDKIIEAINVCKTDKIVILHGTDTMLETANHIENNISNIQKTVILMGSMIPLDGFHQSDAPFNLGYAIAQAENKDFGVYICMNGQTFLPHETKKNIEESRFEFKEAS